MRMTHRTGVLALLAILAALALMYVVRADRLPGGSPAATPTATPGGTATASAGATPVTPASPSPTAVTDRYGYVFVNSSEREERITIRRERDNSSVFELPGVTPAVSPDGKRIAYWRLTPNVGATDLRVVAVADPRTDGSVFSVSADNLGGPMVWSNDGQGLLVGLRSRQTVGGGGVEGGNPARYELLMLDLTSAPPSARPAAEPVSGGRVFIPVAWDRPGKVASGAVTGPGGYAIEYATWNGNAPEQFALVQIPRPLLLAESVRASDDAKLVMAVQDDLTIVRVWPILDVAGAGEVRAATRLSGYPLWRPRSTGPYEVIWVPGQKVDLFRYQTDQSATLFTSSESVGLVAARPDGSAVALVVRPIVQPPVPAGRVLLLDIATRQTSDIAVLTTPLGGNVRVLSRGVLLQ